MRQIAMNDLFFLPKSPRFLQLERNMYDAREKHIVRNFT